MKLPLLLLLCVALLSEGILSASVKDREEEGSSQGEEQGCNVLRTEDDDDTQEDLDELLKNSFNTPENLEKVKAAFTLQPNEVKLCVKINYTVKCAYQDSCLNIRCSKGYNLTMFWTSISSSTLSGSALV